MKITLKLALLAGSALVSSQTLAQTQPTPPEHYTLDERGVDLVTGRLSLPQEVLTIGTGAGSLSSTRTFVQGGWQNPSSRKLHLTATSAIVVQGNISVHFSRSGSTFTPKSNRGQSLRVDGAEYVFRSANGDEERYSIDTCYTTTGNQCVDQYNIVSARRANGEAISYNWQVSEYVRSIDSNGDPVIAYASRLAGISNNFGYSITYGYARSSLGGTGSLNTKLGEWRRNTSVTAANRALDSSSYVAQTIRYSGDTLSSILVTDQNGGVTTYGYDASQNMVSVRYPGSLASDMTLTYEPVYGKVLSLTDRTGTWNYSYVDAGSNRTTTATGPLGQSLTVVSNQTIGRATSMKDALNRTTSYQYDAQGRLERVTQPEGDYVQLAYDARGNVTQTLSVAKPGSGLPNITASAAYPASCANPITCNLPTSTTDARGGITDYAYDPAHGGVTQITLPAPTSGAARPQTRIAYAPQTAWYKNDLGVLAAASSSVTLPVSVSQCVTGSSCAGTSNEVKSSIIYGASGVPNNLLPTSTTIGAGDGSLSATTTVAYTANGDAATVDGPLPGAEDTTTYRYDAARQVIGAVSPDPDGGGPMLHRAQRTTYNPRGQATLVEVGTVNGPFDGDWAAFSSLQQASATYDAYGRITHQRQQVGGVTHSVQQASYDAAGRVDCTTTRMNPAIFSALPTSACDLGASGSFGPDRITRNAYDAAGRLISTTSGLSVDPITESVTYTANGKPLTLTDGQSNVSTIEYDGFDRAVKMRYPNATGGGSSTTDYEQYTYDAAGNTLIHRNRGGDSVIYTYDALNRVTLADATAANDIGYTYDNLGRALSAYGGGQTLSFTWDALGRRTSETGPLGTATSGYDLAGRRTGLAWPDGFFVNYDFNVAGDLTAIRENGAIGWQLASWAYDNLGRRIAQGRANGATTYWSYDAAGRLGGLSHDLPGTADDLSLTFAYNPAGQIVSRTMSNAVYAYAPAAGATSYVNNGKNQVNSVGGSAVSHDGRQNIAAAPMGSYAYDGLNQMISATVGGSTTGFAYDPAGRMVQMGATRLLHDGARPMAEYDASGNVLRRYVPGLDMDETVTAYEGAGLADRRWLLADERQSVVAYTDGAAGVLARNTYDEYGQPSAVNGGLFQYTGQMWMPQAQLYHYKARAYAPLLGRFMQADPIGYQAGSNLYTYVGGDPINLVDPWGLEDEATTLDGPTVTCSRKGVRCGRGTAGSLPNLNERKTSLPQERNDSSQSSDNCEYTNASGNCVYRRDENGDLQLDEDYARQACDSYHAMMRSNATLAAAAGAGGVAATINALTGGQVGPVALGARFLGTPFIAYASGMVGLTTTLLGFSPAPPGCR